MATHPNRFGNSTMRSSATFAEAVESYPELATAQEEAGSPPPVGAVCKHCLSNDLVQSRRTGLYAVAKMLGYKVYRCRQCLSRTIW